MTIVGEWGDIAEATRLLLRGIRRTDRETRRSATSARTRTTGERYRAGTRKTKHINRKHRKV